MNSSWENQARFADLKELLSSLYHSSIVPTCDFRLPAYSDGVAYFTELAIECGYLTDSRDILQSVTTLMDAISTGVRTTSIISTLSQRIANMGYSGRQAIQGTPALFERFVSDYCAWRATSTLRFTLDSYSEQASWEFYITAGRTSVEPKRSRFRQIVKDLVRFLMFCRTALGEIQEDDLLMRFATVISHELSLSAKLLSWDNSNDRLCLFNSLVAFRAFGPFLSDDEKGSFQELMGEATAITVRAYTVLQQAS